MSHFRASPSTSRRLAALVCVLAIVTGSVGCAEEKPSSRIAVIEQKLEVTFPNGAIAAPGEYALFGSNLVNDGDTTFIAAPYETLPNADQAGAVYVYARDHKQWFPKPRLLSTNPESFANFGHALAADSGTLIIGENDSTATWAEVFVRRGDSWIKQADIDRPPEASTDDHADAIAVSGDLAVIGSYKINGRQGAAYVFSRADGKWQLEQGLAASGLVNSDQGTDLASAFGFAVAMGDGFLAVASYNLASSLPQGALHLFTLLDQRWTELTILNPTDGVAGDAFGASISASGSRILVGAPGKTVAGNSEAGAVYAFARTTSGFSQVHRFSAQDVNPMARFGQAVRLDGTVAGIGAPYESVYAQGSGALHIFTESNGHYTEQLRLSANGDLATGIGASVALGEGYALAGNQDGLQTGRVYSYDIGLVNGAKCTAAGDCMSKSCSDGVCCDLACTGECDACSVERGAKVEGTCALLSRGSLGFPRCDALTCNGVSAACANCSSDQDCSSDKFCDASGRCVLRRPQGEACNVAAGKDCQLTGCRVCDLGSYGCVDGLCCNTACDGPCERCEAGECRRDMGCPGDGNAGSGPEAAGGMPGSAGAPGSAGSADTPVADAGDAGNGPESMSGHAGESGSPECVADPACAPYRCRNGMCLQRCITVDDCVAENYCSMDGQCGVRPPQTPTEGCSFAADRRATRVAHAAGWLAAAVVVLCRRQFRRQSRRRLKRKRDSR